MYIPTSYSSVLDLLEKTYPDERTRGIIHSRLIDAKNFDDISEKYFGESPASVTTKIKIVELVRDFENHYLKSK